MKNMSRTLSPRVLPTCLLLLWVAPLWLCASSVEKQNPFFPGTAVLQNYVFDPVPIKIQVDGNPLEGGSFFIPIPDDQWQRVSGKEFVSGATILAGFVHPDGPESGMIQVTSYQPPLEMGAADWLIYTLEQMKMVVTATSTGGLHNPGPLFEVLAVGEMGEGVSKRPIVMRAGVFRQGKTFILVRCVAAPDAFRIQAPYFGTTIHQFEFQEPVDEMLIGEWEKRCVGDYCFTGPATQYHDVASRQPEVIETSIPLSLDESPTGLLNIKTIQNPLAGQTSAKTRVNNLLYNMAEKSGFTFDRNLTSVKSEHQNLEGNALYVRNTGKTSDGSPFELIILSWEGEEGAVLMYMLTDVRETNPIAWMANKRTFEIISSSLK